MLNLVVHVGFKAATVKTQKTAVRWYHLHDIHIRKDFTFIRWLVGTSYLQYPADIPVVVYILPTFAAANLSQPCLPPVWYVMRELQDHNGDTMTSEQDDAPHISMQWSMPVSTQYFLANGLDMRDITPAFTRYDAFVFWSVWICCGMWLARAFQFLHPSVSCINGALKIGMAADYGHFYRFRMKLPRVDVLL